MGSFILADTLAPEVGQPRGWNRYGYVYGNPIKYTDPSGHCPPSICRDEQGKPLDAYYRWGDREYLNSLSLLTPNPWYPVDTVPRSFEGIAIYPPDAFMIGFSGSANLGISTTPDTSFSVDFGMEDVLNFNTGDRTVFSYHGAGYAKGASANVAAYFGFIWNLPENHNYRGDFESVTGTLSLGHGITVTYFWAPGQEPFVKAFSSENTKGFAIGYAPGVGGSVSYNQTVYNDIQTYR